jgi:hypothetical protein
MGARHDTFHLFSGPTSLLEELAQPGTPVASLQISRLLLDHIAANLLGICKLHVELGALDTAFLSVSSESFIPQLGGRAVVPFCGSRRRLLRSS